eukprot:g3861.t1
MFSKNGDNETTENFSLLGDTFPATSDNTFPPQQQPQADTFPPPVSSSPSNVGAGKKKNEEEQKPKLRHPRNADLVVDGNMKSKTIAATIAYRARQGEAPNIQAESSRTINEVVKGLSIARSFVENNFIDFIAFPKNLPPLSEGSDNYRILLKLSKVQLRNHTYTFASEDKAEIKVGKSNIATKKIAGSIAKFARAGKRISVTAIGAASVTNAVQSLAIARKYVSDDGLDICFSPQFVSLKLESGLQSSAIRLNCFVHQI